MKVIRIDFIENHRWRSRLWMITISLCIALGFYLSWQFSLKRFLIVQETNKLEAQQLKLELLRKPAKPQIKLQNKSILKALTILKSNLNTAFSSAENLKIQSARLRTFTINTQNNLLHMEYDLETITAAASVTDLLNTGYEQKPWQLEAISSSNNTSTNATPLSLTISSTYAFKGIWNAKLNAL